MTIVYIDDSPSEFMALADDGEAAISAFAFESNDPNEHAFVAAKAADVWLFDFFLVADPHDENGLSLFQKWKATIGGRPTTVVVSSDVEKAVGEPLGPIERHHVIAQKHGVEWIGDKTKDTLNRVLELSGAADFIAKNLDLKPIEGRPLGTYDSEQLCIVVLGVPRDAEWANSAMRQIDRARPPREVSTSSAAATAHSIISWLLAHVLPYPSFLLTDAQAALRLKIQPATFRSMVAESEGNEAGAIQRGIFENCRYLGPLKDFLGRRWWRAAIDDLAWHLSQDTDGYRVALGKLATKTSIEWLEHSEPVLVSNSYLVETDEIAEAKDCVRVTDEDFPANVDAAWILIRSAQEDRQLTAKVIYEDRDVLSSGE